LHTHEILDCNRTKITYLGPVVEVVLDAKHEVVKKEEWVLYLKLLDVVSCDMHFRDVWIYIQIILYKSGNFYSRKSQLFPKCVVLNIVTCLGRHRGVFDVRRFF
jgi:hypothetical protein